MPHGVELSIDRDRLMDAEVPTAEQELTHGGTTEVESPAEEPETSGLERRAMNIGEREGKEAMQQGEADAGGGQIRDMARGILENAGLITSGMEEDRVDALVNAFTRGWDQADMEGVGDDTDGMVDSASVFV
jgi:hypothetical protein